MKGALETFVSLCGVASACYVIAMATWQQLLFFVCAACVGWAVFVAITEERKRIYPHKARLYLEIEEEDRLNTLIEPVVQKERPLPPSRAHRPFVPQEPVLAVRRSFPIHNLAR